MPNLKIPQDAHRRAVKFGCAALFATAALSAGLAHAAVWEVQASGEYWYGNTGPEGWYSGPATPTVEVRHDSPAPGREYVYFAQGGAGYTLDFFFDDQGVDLFAARNPFDHFLTTTIIRGTFTIGNFQADFSGVPLDLYAQPGSRLPFDAHFTGGEVAQYGFAQYGSDQFQGGCSDLERETLTAIAAPEPSAWALMLVGFGMAGTALRRRKMIAC